MDSDLLGKDDVIGEAELSLLPVFKSGTMEQWVTVGAADQWGRMTEAGEIKLIFDFFGPPGLAYPMLQSGVDTYVTVLSAHTLN